MAGKLEDLFGAKFVLPEHREAILAHQEEKKLILQPVTEEDELMELHYRIQDSIQFDYAVTISWWRKVKGEWGELHTVWGIVKNVDITHNRLKIVNDEEALYVDIESIVMVRGK